MILKIDIKNYCKEWLENDLYYWKENEFPEFFKYYSLKY